MGIPGTVLLMYSLQRVETQTFETATPVVDTVAERDAGSCALMDLSHWVESENVWIMDVHF